jgi:hypothetical protein
MSHHLQQGLVGVHWMVVLFWNDRKIDGVGSSCGTECLNGSPNFVERFGLTGVRGKLASS